jgi:hypothetical protein
MEREGEMLEGELLEDGSGSGDPSALWEKDSKRHLGR